MRPVFSPLLSHMPMILTLAPSFFSRLTIHSRSNTTIERQKHTVIACHHNSELHSCKEQCWFCCRWAQRKWEANGKNAKNIAVVHCIASICRVYELAATFAHFAPFIYSLFAICSLTTFESNSFPHSFFLSSFSSLANVQLNAHRRDGGKFIVCIIFDCCCSVPFMPPKCVFSCCFCLSGSICAVQAYAATWPIIVSSQFIFFCCWMFGNKSSRSRLQIFLIRSDSLNEMIAHSHPVNSTWWKTQSIIPSRNSSRPRTHSNVDAKNDISRVAFHNLQFIKSSSNNSSDFNADEQKRTSGSSFCHFLCLFLWVSGER